MSDTIYCCGCKREVQPRLTNGREVYPHRKDLARAPFWICDTCNNYVGCHRKSNDPTRPLGVIPTPELRYERRKLHSILDPIWKSGQMKRAAVYQWMADALGVDEFHVGNTKSIDEIQHAIVKARLLVQKYDRA